MEHTILIADSGSTTTAWHAVTNRGSVSLETEGLNPFFVDEAAIAQIVTKKVAAKLVDTTVSEVYFYGSGCLGEKSEVAARALAAVFPAAQIEVASDLLGAARGLLGQEAGIAAILGTGSNSGYYDGRSITAQVPALGFILGDEGSGAVLGRRLLGDLFKNQLPDKLATKLTKKYKLTQQAVVESVYRQPFPNRYLAQFVPFLHANLHESAIYNLVFDSFTDFLLRNVAQYPLCRDVPVAFTGSVAFYFRDVLEVAAYELGLEISKIDQSPIEGLVDYHTA